jgi:hypothetical protein
MSGWDIAWDGPVAKVDENKAPIYVAYIITAIWVISVVADLFVKEYDPPPGVLQLMLLVAGYLFTREILPRKNRSGDDKNTDSEEASHE